MDSRYFDYKGHVQSERELEPLGAQRYTLFAFTALYVFTASGIGLFIATISRSLGQVTMLVILLMMPIILLSGAWTPPEAMPAALHYAMAISPLYCLNEISHAILLKGAGIDILWDSVLGAVFFNFGVWRFRRQFG